MSLVIKGKRVETPGFQTQSWMDLKGMRGPPGDRRRRMTPWVRSLILHTTVGDEPQVVRSGSGSSGMAARSVAASASDQRHAGPHIIVDGDGVVFCLADLATEVTFHARSINEVSIGIELAQTNHLEIYTCQLEATVLLCDFLTRWFQIQRQIHTPYLGDSHAVARLSAGGEDCVGVFGHRDQSTERSSGDPGNAVFKYLVDAGYEAWNFDTGSDLDVWKVRQQLVSAGQPDQIVRIDGVPGPATVAAIMLNGNRSGLWVRRPGD